MQNTYSGTSPKSMIYKEKISNFLLEHHSQDGSPQLKPTTTTTLTNGKFITFNCSLQVKPKAYLINPLSSSLARILKAPKSSTPSRYEVMDMSHFLLVEAIGDSEELGEGDPSLIKSHNLITICCDDSIAGEDDAESCSCDFEEDNSVGFDEAKDCENEDASEENDDREFSRRNQMMGVAKVSMLSMEEGEAESRICGAKDDEFEMEGNRLFWETCLEVGYP